MAFDSVEKSARKELRLAKIQPEDIVLVNNGTLAFTVAKHLLKEIFPRHEIKEGKQGLFPISRDEQNAQFLTSFFEDRALQEKDFFLNSISYDDLVNYAKKHNLEIKNPLLDENEQLTLDLLKDLQEDQSQTMAALHNSFENLRKSNGKKKETKKKTLVNIKK